MSDGLVIAGRSFASRLFLGTGKFPSNAALRSTIEACGTEMVTVALRRVDPTAEEDILDAVPADRVLLLTNTSGAENADEAVRLARLARAAGLPDWIKLEITPDPRYLLPDPVETLRAAEILCAEGFTVLPYVNADPVLCKRLGEVGCATVMPLGSWIGSNQGLRARGALEIIVEQSLVPVVVDSCIGAPSDGVAPSSAAGELLAFLGGDLDRLVERSSSAGPIDVERALRSPRRDLDDLAALLSPAAAARLDDLAAVAHRLTLRRFGRVVRL